MLVIAAAGLAEAVFEICALVGQAGLFGIVCLLSVAFMRRSRFASAAAAILTLPAAVFCQPWLLWTSVTLSDPDEEYWNGAFQKLGIAWLLVIVASGVAVVYCFGVRRPTARAADNSAVS